MIGVNPLSVQKEIDVIMDYGDPEVTGGVSVFDKAFDDKFYYNGDDLGAVYTPEKTSFRLWAPTASEAKVVFYSSWDSLPVKERAMVRDVQGTWVLETAGDYHGVYYTYRVKVGTSWNEAADPYAKAVGVNGDRAVVLDLRRTDPERWTGAMPPFSSPVDAVIYELHVRDLSIHPDSGIQHKGKYLGLAESGTRGPGGFRPAWIILQGWASRMFSCSRFTIIPRRAWMRPNWMSRILTGATIRKIITFPRAPTLRIRMLPLPGSRN